MFDLKVDELNKVWSSNPDLPLVFNPNISIAHLLLKSMEVHGLKIAQISDDTGERLTFNEIRMKSIRAAQNLQARGFNTKQIVGIISGNVTDLAPIIFASFCLGCPVNPFHSSVKKNQLLHMLYTTEPNLIFCEASVYDLVVDVLNDLGNHAKVFTLNGTRNGAEAVESLFKETGIEEHFLPVKVDGINESALIMSTSGSTGPSKGVCLSHAALITETESIGKMYSDGILFNSSNIFWTIGIFYGICLGTIGGSTRIISNKPLSVELQLRIIKDYRVTIIENPSYFLLVMLKSGLMAGSDLSSVKHLICSGYKIPPSIMEQFNAYLPNGNVNNAYGLTELGDVSVDYPRFSGKDSAGRLVHVVGVKIVDEKGNRRGINTLGEICVKTRHKFLGYYKNEKLTNEAFDDEGFFKTGDIGLIDEDGYLQIADRIKNVILQRQDRVFPAEVEELLLKSPEINRVCVVGVPSDEGFELPAALVVRSKDCIITEKNIHKMVEENLRPACKLEGGVYFVDSIKVTATGKPLLPEARRIAKKMYLASSFVASSLVDEAVSSSLIV